MAQTTKARGAFHIPSLDGIRAIAAMLVFVAHAGLKDVVPGGFGVTIFFFLSGYLITTLLRMEFEASAAISLKKFYLRRAFRIWPPMYVALIIAAIPPYVGPADITPGAVLAQSLHLTNYYLIFVGYEHIIPSTGPMWSLAVEEHFYLLYPVALIFLLRRYAKPTASATFLAVCGLILIWRCVMVYWIGYGHEYTYLASDARFDSLLFGCVLGLSLNPVLDKQEVFSPARWVLILTIAVGLLLFTFLYRSQNFRDTVRYTIQGVALFPMFYCAIRFPHWPIFRWLEWSWIRYFGIVTYTFYLVHWKALDLASLLVNNPIARALVAFALALAFAAVMYRLVEGPLGDLRRRLHS